MITVVIPALNESAGIGGVIRLAQKYPGVTEVIVVDDGSVDNTAEIAAAANAQVITSSLRGKGGSMRDGLLIAQNEIIVYLDGDLRGLREDLIEILVQPILDDGADFVKARFSRSAGRVTTLTARPLLQLFFPELADFVQPLGGIIAAKASLLRDLKFETDYGVDLGLLIDAQMLGARITEVDIGHLDHDSQSLEALGEMSKQVVRSLLHRAHRYDRFSADQIQDVEETERHMQAGAPLPKSCVAPVNRLAIFDMDGTLLRGRFIVELAKKCGKERELAKWLDNHNVGTEERSSQIAAIFAGVPKETFEETAINMELMPSAVETVVQLRKLGFIVGIVSDSYRIATEIVKRRVFADFSVANMVRFRSGVACGEFTVSPLLAYEQGCTIHKLCKQNVVQHLKDSLLVQDHQVLVVGDGLNDTCMLSAAGLSVAIDPKHELVRRAAQHGVFGDLAPIIPLVHEHWSDKSGMPLLGLEYLQEPVLS